MIAIKIARARIHTLKFVFGSSCRSPYVSTYLWDVWCIEVFFYRFVACAEMSSAIIKT